MYTPVLTVPYLAGFNWLIHGFGRRGSEYPESIVTVRQIHSGLVIEAPIAGGDRFAEADGLVSNRAGAIVGIRTADCVPILIVDEGTRSVAAVHAGWRGSAKNIVGTAVNELIARFNVRAENLHAAIGPAIGPCCYQVGPEVARQFGTWCPETPPEGAQPLDLPAVNEAQLRKAGVRDIWQARACTFCNPEHYFSYRREKEEAGRMVSFVGIRVSK